MKTMRVLKDNIDTIVGEVDIEAPYNDIRRLWQELEENPIKCVNPECPGFFQVVDVNQYHLWYIISLKCSHCDNTADLTPQFENQGDNSKDDTPLLN